MTEKLTNLSRVVFDKDAGDYLMGNDVNFDGELAIQQYVQSTVSRLWKIDLNVQSEFVQVFVFLANEDGTYSMVQPNAIRIQSGNQVEIEFNEEVSGIVNILLGSDAQELILVTPTPTVTMTPSVTPTPV